MAFTGRNVKGKALTETELDNNFLCHYPIGSIYISCSPAFDSPGGLIGYGTWSKFAKGRALVSSTAIAAAGTDLNYSPGRGIDSGSVPAYPYGSPSHTLTEKELPKHTHTWEKDPYQSQAANQGAGSGVARVSGNYDGYDFSTNGTNIYRLTRSDETGTAQFTNSPTTFFVYNRDFSTTTKIQEPGQPHNNLQPYVVVNIWKRDS